MPTTSIARTGTTQTVNVTVTGAPPLKADYVYYEVTELAITYEDDKLTRLRMLAIAEDSGQAEWLQTRLDAWETVEPWIRDEVEKHRPSRQAAALRAKTLQEAYDVVSGYIREGAPCDDTECLMEATEEIGEKIREAERAAVPSMPPMEFLGMFINIAG
ncbi:hypothetical protein [Streptomyces sp. NPDC055105]|uniref:hypothetical protein n=1 Tax=Streptomyces sp. NPDC055105 TaxID=3365719 RepID=UPI0037D2B913